MRKRIAWIAGVLFAGVIGWYVTLAPAYYSRLSMPMRVQLEQPTNAVLVKRLWVRSGFVSHKSALDRLLTNLDRVEQWAANGDVRMPELFDGKAFAFQVLGSDCGSLLGITLSYSQHNFIFIIAELANGQRIGAVADIPDARTTREMWVTLP